MGLLQTRVFVVEDDKTMQAFVMACLRRLGIQDIFAFADGSSALARMVELRPDIVITDVHMQPMGGVELVETLRGHGNSLVSRTPVIFLTADASSATLSQVVLLGVQGYIVKPPNWQTLGQKIEAALGT